MPNKELERLTVTQAAAVARCVEKARQAAGLHSESLGKDQEAYAYRQGCGCISWSVNASVNIARGVESAACGAEARG